MTHLFAREKTTNPNSPPWDKSNPILTLSWIVSPTRGPIAVMIRVLMTIKPAKSESTFGHSRIRSCRDRKKWWLDLIVISELKEPAQCTGTLLDFKLLTFYFKNKLTKQMWERKRLLSLLSKILSFFFLRWLLMNNNN